MANKIDDFLSIISRARGGASDATGELLEPYRNYLRLLAAAQLRKSIEARVSPSDIVQDAMFAAYQNIGAFRGNSAPEFTVWLRTILTRCLWRTIESNTKTAKRDVRQEISINRMQRSIDSSSICAVSMLAAATPTPSQIVSREEEVVYVANLVSQLPQDYQEVIALRNFGSMRFEEIAIKMNRSEQAVRLLWLRAVRRLRVLHQRSDAGSC